LTSNVKGNIKMANYDFGATGWMAAPCTKRSQFKPRHGQFEDPSFSIR